MAVADLTRQRLIRAGLELFTTQGYHVTTTVQIAKKAGVAEGTIYKHFESKQHLLNELYRGAARWAARAAEEADATPGPVQDRLQLLAHRLVAGASQDPAVMQLYFVDRHRNVLDEKSRDAGREFHNALERLLARGKSDGVIRPGAAEVWSGVWLGVVRQALERVVTREWSESSAGVRQSIEAAWLAICR
ncbi:MAG TPA: TetR/AcrR family transcriptional regulator [Gemmatimonadales bacterium]|nr:TetR/AcrR family transcriptional regulator [Gemmatimonadales bacterium]